MWASTSQSIPDQWTLNKGCGLAHHMAFVFVSLNHFLARNHVVPFGSPPWHERPKTLPRQTAAKANLADQYGMD